MDTTQNPIILLRKQIAIKIMMKYLFISLPFIFFSAGIIFIIFNILNLNFPKFNIFSIVFAVHLIILAIFFIFKQSDILYPKEKIRALLDKYNNCGGLYISEEELNIEQWQEHIPQINLPKIQYKSKNLNNIILLSALFCIASLFAPKNLIDKFQKVNTKDDINRLIAKVDTLTDEDIITEEKSKILKEAIYTIEDKANSEDAMDVLEAIDHINKDLNMTGKEASNDIANSMKELSLAENAMNSLLSEEPNLNSNELTQALQDMSNMISQSLKKAPKMGNSLSEEEKNALKNASLSPDLAKKLLDKLSKSKEGMNKSLSELMSSRLINKKNFKDALKNSKYTKEDMMKYLAKANSERLKKLLQQGKCNKSGGCGKEGCGNKPGSGGGPTDMTWKDENSDANNADFMEIEIPINQLTSLLQSQLLGTSYTSPQAQEVKTTSTQALKNIEKAHGGANKHLILPKYKGTVQKYFDNK